MISEQQVLAKLKEITDPVSKRDIVSLGFISDLQVKDKKVSFNVSPRFQKKAEEAVLSLDGVQIVKANPALAQKNIPQNPLPDIGAVIAVSSCKGGVGKSTIAVHLAQEFASRGKKVGLLDADIYGPSIPALLNLNPLGVQINEKQQMIPVTQNGLKVISMGFLLGNAPAVMRGPIVTRYIQQLLLGTDWGRLDYLFIDMPPGTGDIHLTITQTIPLSGAVIVTTPHTLSLVDVSRGIIMFEKVNVPILGIIENMAYYQVPGTNEKHYLFGESPVERLTDSLGVPVLSEIPVLPSLSRSQENPVKIDFVQATADQLEKSLALAAMRENGIHEIEFDAKTVKLSWTNGEIWIVKNFDLRLISKDALSVNEMTGKQIIKPGDIRPDIAAKEVLALGNYAIGVTWNDGHSAAIYPFKDIRTIADIQK